MNAPPYNNRADTEAQSYEATCRPANRLKLDAKGSWELV